MTTTNVSMSDTEAMDPTVRPQDDLFRHVNGAWLREHVIPADRARDGSFLVLRDLSEERVRAIIEDAARRTAGAEPGANVDAGAAPGGQESGGAELPGNAENARKIGDAYASFMATERIEALGTNPLRADLDLL